MNSPLDSLPIDPYIARLIRISNVQNMAIERLRPVLETQGSPAPHSTEIQCYYSQVDDCSIIAVAFRVGNNPYMIIRGAEIFTDNDTLAKEALVFNFETCESMGSYHNFLQQVRIDLGRSINKQGNNPEKQLSLAGKFDVVAESDSLSTLHTILVKAFAEMVPYGDRKLWIATQNNTLEAIQHGRDFVPA